MLSNNVESYIKDAIERFDYTMESDVNDPFEKILSMGELVDRLSIVNFKLYNVKIIQDDPSSTKEELADSAEKDVRLCKERARLKRCIDEKLLTVITRVMFGDETGGMNKEVKNY